jgi:hypothetical protein
MSDKNSDNKSEKSIENNNFTENSIDLSDTYFSESQIFVLMTITIVFIISIFSYTIYETFQIENIKEYFSYNAKLKTFKKN